MRIIFDLDGVLRDFETAVWGAPQETWRKDVEGIPVHEFLDRFPYVVAGAPPTVYLDVVKACLSHVRILTCQADKLRQPTTQWVAVNVLGDVAVDLNYVYSPQEKLERMKDDEILIEDNPYFDGRENVVLIDKAYNRHCKNRRISNPEELIELIKEYK